MIDHLGISVTDLAKSRAFYTKALAAARLQRDDGVPGALGFGAKGKPDFWLGQGPASGKVHVAFESPDRKTVDAFHAAGARRRRQGQRQARPAPAVPPQLLRRLRVRPRRQQHRGGLRTSRSSGADAMPILEVEDRDRGRRARSTRRSARRSPTPAGEVFESVAGRTWVRLRELPVDRYAENGGGPLEGVLPVFVDVLLADPPQGEELRLQVHRLTLAIAKIVRARARERAPLLPGLRSRSGRVRRQAGRATDPRAALGARSRRR